LLLAEYIKTNSLKTIRPMVPPLTVTVSGGFREGQRAHYPPPFLLEIYHLMLIKFKI
jgi:hypothetical protein